MSIFNILMYPRRAQLDGRKVMEDAPPLVRDVLDGKTR